MKCMFNFSFQWQCNFTTKIFLINHFPIARIPMINHLQWLVLCMCFVLFLLFCIILLLFFYHYFFFIFQRSLWLTFKVPTIFWVKTKLSRWCLVFLWSMCKRKEKNQYLHINVTYLSQSKHSYDCNSAANIWEECVKGTLNIWRIVSLSCCKTGAFERKWHHL